MIRYLVEAHGLGTERGSGIRAEYEGDRLVEMIFQGTQGIRPPALAVFISELKRRNVFKVGVAYAIVAWLLIQVVSIVVPAYQAPDWVMPILITLG